VNGTPLPLVIRRLTSLEGSLVRRNKNIQYWSTTISSSLFQKRTVRFKVLHNLHHRNDAEGLSSSGAGGPVEESKIIGTPSNNINETRTKES